MKIENCLNCKLCIILESGRSVCLYNQSKIIDPDKHYCINCVSVFSDILLTADQVKLACEIIKNNKKH